MTKTPETAGPILHRITNLDRPGTVHIASVSRRGGFTTFCQGRHIAYGIGAGRAVSCALCIRKAAGDPQAAALLDEAEAEVEADGFDAWAADAGEPATLFVDGAEVIR